MKILIEAKNRILNTCKSKSRQSLLGIFETERASPVRWPFCFCCDFAVFFKRAISPASLLFINNIRIDRRDDCGGKDPRHQNRKGSCFPGEKDANKSGGTAENHQPRTEPVSPSPNLFAGKGPGEAETHEIIVPDPSHNVAHNDKQEGNACGYPFPDIHRIAEGCRVIVTPNISTKKRCRAYRIVR